MNTLKLTSQFKKDLKRYKYKIEIIDKLEVLLKLLVMGNRFQLKTSLTF